MMKKQRSSPTPFDFSELKRLDEVSHRVLMLDYDGTLAPFRAARMEARPYLGITEAVSDLCLCGHTRVVIVSGRPVHEILELLPDVPPLEIWGGHGWERRLADGAVQHWLPGAAVDAQLDAAAGLMGDIVPAAEIERKQGSVAVHARRLEPAARAVLVQAVEDRWRPLSERCLLQLRAFDGGFELRDPSRSKGTVVADIRAGYGDLPPERLLMAYLGDDETDEDAFDALGHGDMAILVREEPRLTAAAHWLKPPNDLLRFIRTWTLLGR